jgi:hypothetical protein
MGEIRECRLRAEYGHLYEGIPADVWQPAPVVAEQLVLRARKGRMLQIQQRTFDQRHFEFRGGPAAPARPRTARTRRGDQGLSKK